MITITNIGHHSGPKTFGTYNYELKVNNIVICRFQHKRSAGITRCLVDASKAAAKQQWEDALMLFELDGKGP